MKHLNKILLSILATSLCSHAALAQTDKWPSKPITVIVPYTPGGSTDTVTRVVMQKLSERLGQTVVVENKPGANSTIGVAQAARAAGDGYTFVAILAAYAVNFSLYDLNYKAEDFVPVSLIADLLLFLFTSKDIPAKNLKELVEYGKTHPLTYGSSGNGSSSHMTGAHFAQIAGLEMTHVPYRGSAPILADLLAGRVSMTFDPILVPMPHVKEGKLNVVGVTSAKRFDGENDIPTFDEQGYKGFVMNSWTSLLAPKGTPDDVVQRVSSEIAEIVKEPDVIEKFKNAGFVPVGSTPAELNHLIEHDRTLYKKIIDEAKITLK